MADQSVCIMNADARAGFHEVRENAEAAGEVRPGLRGAHAAQAAPAAPAAPGHSRPGDAAAPPGAHTAGPSWQHGLPGPSATPCPGLGTKDAG